MKSNISMIALALFALSNCGLAPLEVDSRLKYNSSFDQSKITRGYETGFFLKSEVSTHDTDEHGYVRGGTCTAKNRDFTITTEANQLIVLPVYQSNPGPIHVTCEYNGRRISKTQQAEPVITNTLGNIAGVTVTENLSEAVGANPSQGYDEIASQSGEWSYKYIFLTIR